ncbi:MAG: LSM domain-containing protein [Candidatus Thermoplasmatota archaeon]
MTQTDNRPLTVLNNNLGNNVIVELRYNKEYRGKLDGYDPHLNLVMEDVKEFIDGEKIREMDKALVRGDNVVYVSP